jgi:LAO/AO transport system kinase
MDLHGRLLAGDVRALARAISLAEDRDPAATELVQRLQPHTGHAYLIGLTGPPGSGKSTLADALVAVIRGEGKTVAVVAVDPTSPFTGGAILGDRVRMQRHTLDQGVFIRSMGARGHLGGLAAATREALRLLDAFGRDYILVETVGVGQSELEIASICDTTLLVLMPESGDSVQTIKAGIMEIADIFVVNKADLPGAEKTRRLIQESLTLGTPRSAYTPPICLTAATRGEGLDPLWQAIGAHRRFLESSGGLDERRRNRIRQEVIAIVAEQARNAARQLVEGEGALARRLREAPIHDLDPYLLAAAVETPERERHRDDRRRESHGHS